MKIEDVLKYFESQSELARLLGLTRYSVSLWKRDGIPPMRAIEIERLTNGHFKASDIVGLKSDTEVSDKNE